VSLALEAGRFITLLGPSGCGKTTLLRLIGGLETPDSGVVSILGRPVADFAPTERPTRMVFQSYALFPHMRVADNVAYGLKIRGATRQDAARQVAAQLETVGLADKARAYPSELSGGQQQRVALARALITRPQVLLLDEPLAALDLKLRQRLQAELKSVQQAAGITFIFVTHDQHEALALSDEVIVMDRGRIVQRAAPAALYDRPANRYVAAFVGEATVLPATRAGVAPVANTPIGPVPVAGGATGANLAAVIRPEGVHPHPDGPFQGIVRAATYRGADVLAEIEIAGCLVRACFAGADRALAVPGQAVRLAIAAHSVWIIAEDPITNQAGDST
jgi:spermidine/putrescine transport system ATP-binding protein